MIFSVDHEFSLKLLSCSPKDLDFILIFGLSQLRLVIVYGYWNASLCYFSDVCFVCYLEVASSFQFSYPFFLPFLFD